MKPRWEGILLVLSMLLTVQAQAQGTNSRDWHNAPIAGLVQTGDLKGLKEALEKGVSPNTLSPLGNSLMMEAVIWKKREILLFLLKAGADVKAKGNAGIVAYACMANDFEMVKALVDAGAALDQRSGSGSWESAMVEAVKAGNLNILEYLLNHGADPNDKSGFGTAALHMAAAEGNVQMLSLLLSKGAEINIRDNYGQTPLMYACREGEAEAVEFLLDHGADADLEDGYGRKASHMVPHSEGNEEIRILCTGKREKEANASPSP